MKENVMKLLAAMFLAGMLTGCSDDDVQSEVKEKNVELVSFSHSGCKGHPGAKPLMARVSDDADVEKISYQAMSDGRLFVCHMNALFCCAQEELKTTASLSGNEIWIVEEETGAMANCVCRYDLESIIGGLQERTYTVAVYVAGNTTPVARFELHYSSHAEGEFVINRTSD